MAASFFFVEIGHPLTGLIVRYRGWLVPQNLTPQVGDRSHRFAVFRHQCCNAVEKVVNRRNLVFMAF
jgi:hypothetical protein